MTHYCLSLTNRKVVREKNGSGPFHAECSSGMANLPVLRSPSGSLSFAPWATSSRIDRGNMQSHSRDATVAPRGGVAASLLQINVNRCLGRIKKKVIDLGAYA